MLMGYIKRKAVSFMLEKEFALFEAKKEEFIQNHKDQYVLIVGDDVIGFFDSEDKAIQEALKSYDPGKFLVQKCSEDSDQVMRFHSRVLIS
jgi:hypothetical protein